MSQNSSPQRYDFIDALRGIAFLGVLIHHTAPRVLGLDPRIARLANQGHEGVELFFLLSAMTLFLSLDARKTERHPIVNYSLRRFFRITPLFYAGAVFYYLFDLMLGGGERSGGSSLACILSTLTFTNAWSVPWINQLVPGGWSIAVEMNFYLLVPLLYKKLRTLQVAAAAAFVALVCGGLASTIGRMVFLRLGLGTEKDIGLFTWYWLPTQLPIFLLGCVLYFLVKPIVKNTPGDTLVPRVNPSLLLALAVYLMIALSFSETSLYLSHGLFGVAFLLVGWSLAMRPNALLVNPFTCSLGRVSFSAYITHFAILELSVKGLSSIHILGPLSTVAPTLQFAALVAVTLVGTYLTSSLTYRLIELPGQAAGRNLIRFLETREPQADRAVTAQLPRE
jgi:peptidoglycan/LPS O-acetylase OafA/YrhL